MHQRTWYATPGEFHKDTQDDDGEIDITEHGGDDAHDKDRRQRCCTSGYTLGEDWDKHDADKYIRL